MWTTILQLYSFFSQYPSLPKIIKLRFYTILFTSFDYITNLYELYFFKLPFKKLDLIWDIPKITILLNNNFIFMLLPSLFLKTQNNGQLFNKLFDTFVCLLLQLIRFLYRRILKRYDLQSFHKELWKSCIWVMRLDYFEYIPIYLPLMWEINKFLL